MNFYTDISEIEKDENTFLTLGTFDGIHKGHLKIINTLIAKSGKSGGRSFVVTFEPHPRLVLSKENNIKLLTSLDEKKKVLNELGVENLLVLKFSKEFASKDYDDFIQEYIVKGIGAKHIVIGYDHKFGKNRSGDKNKLEELGKKFGFDVDCIQPVEAGDEVISSTKIRKALNDGNVETAEEYLGRSYNVTGEIVEGSKRGKTIGFPTANVRSDFKNKLIPKNGVYFVECILNEKRIPGIMNIGVRPTFEDDKKLVLEVHLYNFDENVYGEELEIFFKKRIRDEKKFNSKEELVEQITKDKEAGRKLIND